MRRRFKRYHPQRNLETMETWGAAKLAYCIDQGWVESWPLEVTEKGFQALHSRRDERLGRVTKMPPPPVTPYTPPKIR